MSGRALNRRIHQLWEAIASSGVRNSLKIEYWWNQPLFVGFEKYTRKIKSVCRRILLPADLLWLVGYCQQQLFSFCGAIIVGSSCFSKCRPIGQ